LDCGGKVLRDAALGSNGIVSESGVAEYLAAALQMRAAAVQKDQTFPPVRWYRRALRFQLC